MGEHEQDISQRTAALFAWLNQVKSDPDTKTLPASAFKVAFELGQWINGAHFSKTGALLAWPSLKSIAKAIGMSERTARDMTARLEAKGYLQISEGHGPGNPSRYTLTMRQPAAALNEGKSGSPPPLSGPEKRQPSAGKAAAYDTESGSRLPTNHNNHSSNHESAARGVMDWKKEANGTYTIKCESDLGIAWSRYCSANRLPQPIRSTRTDCFVGLKNLHPPEVEVAA